MTATYLATSGLDHVEQAQSDLNQHLVARPDGTCAACAEVEPCRARQTANARILGYGMLPRRVPGLAGVLAIGFGPSDGRSGWFDTTPAG